MPPKRPSKKKVAVSPPKKPANKTKKSAAPKSAKTASLKSAAKKPTTPKSAVKKSTASKSAAKKPTTLKSAAKKSPTPKSAAKKSPTPSAPAPAPAAPAASSAPTLSEAYTLRLLIQRTGPATVEEARSLVAVPDAQLITEGAQVATGRITVDCARNYGQALDIHTRATPKIKAVLLGVTPDLLRIAIFSAQHGAELDAQRSEELAVQKTRQSARRSDAGTVLGRGNARRDQLRALCRAITGDEETWGVRIDAAYGIAKKPENLARALTQLASIGAELLAITDDDDLQKRRKDSGLDAALLTEVRDLAAAVAELGPAGKAARALSAVSQSAVDLWDGINLLLFERIMNLVNAAHELEPSIPRLVPIALRSYFYGGSGKKAAATPLPDAPA